MSGSGDAAERPRRWSQLHHGIDPASVPLLPGWLAIMWRLARPLARLGVPPTAVTVCGVLLALGAVAAAASMPFLAAGLVLLAAVCDGLDGAVAVVADRAGRAGTRADAVADRIADLAFAAVLWRCGAPWPLALAAGALAVAVDLYRRARGVPARITVAERPSGTVCVVLAAAGAAVWDARWPQVVCACVWIALALIGLAQLRTADVPPAPAADPAAGPAAGPAPGCGSGPAAGPGSR